MAIKIEMLRCFAEVARSGSLAGAAERLNRTPSAVSMMLKQLEEQLGQPLFQSDRKSRLSPLGAFVLEQAQMELRHFDRTLQTIERFALAGAGLVRLASVPSVAGTILPLALKAFRDRHREVQLDLRDMDSTSIVNALRLDEIDIGVATVPASMIPPDRPALFEDRFGIVCARDHPLAHSKSPLGWEGLRGETLIANDLCAGIASPVFQAIYRQATLTVQNTVSLLAMVDAGLGVTVLPKLAAELDRERVVFLPVDDPQATRRIDLLHRTGSHVSPAAQALADQVHDAAGEYWS